MQLLDFVFLLCARFIALREHRCKRWRNDTITVNFNNGAQPVEFYRERVETSYQKFELQWKASRQMTKQELKIVEQVLLRRNKRERRKFRKTFPEPTSQTEFSFNRIRQNLVFGKCKEFPTGWYLQNIIDRVRQHYQSDGTDFALKPYEGHRHHNFHSMICNVVSDTELIRKPFHWSESSHSKDEFTVFGTALIEDKIRIDRHYATYPPDKQLLHIIISVGMSTGFSNPNWRRKYTYELIPCDGSELDTKPACAIPLHPSED